MIRGSRNVASHTNRMQRHVASHIAKPLDVQKMMETLTEVLK